MTSRLKHKLEIENINLKSAYLNESFVYVSALASLGRITDIALDWDTATCSSREQEGQA